MTAQFKDRLFEAMKNKGVKSADVCRATGFSSSLISQYMTGKIEPKNDKAYILADYFGVSPAWLLGWIDDKNPQDDISKEEEAELIDAYKKTTPEIRKAIRLMLGIDNER